MPEPTPLRRSLEQVTITIRDGHVVLTFLCDCASVTELVTDITPSSLTPTFIQELAYTCDGCHTSHRFTLYGTPTQEGRPE